MLLSANMIRVHDIFGVRGMLDVFAKAGFEGVDFNNDIPEFYTAEHDRAFYRELGNCAREKGIAICQAHAVYPPSFPDDVEKTEKRFFEIVQGMQNAAYLGAPMIVVHPCTHLDCTVDGNFEKMYQCNLSFYRRLIPYAKEFGIKIAIENLRRAAVTNMPDALCRLYDELNDSVFTVCLDVGHCFLHGVDPADAIRILGDRLVHGCLHIHDNMGAADEHTLPYYGKIEWESVMKALADIGYEGNFNYEASGFIKDVPTDLRPEGLAFMAKVGHYLVSRFEYYKKNR